MKETKKNRQRLKETGATSLHKCPVAMDTTTSFTQTPPPPTFWKQFSDLTDQIIYANLTGALS